MTKDAERLAEIHAHVANNRVPSWQSPDWKQHYGWRQQDIEVLLLEIARLTQERDAAIARAAEATGFAEGLKKSLDHAAADRDRAIAERDEARRSAEAIQLSGGLDELPTSPCNAIGSARRIGSAQSLAAQPTPDDAHLDKAMADGWAATGYMDFARRA